MEQSTKDPRLGKEGQDLITEFKGTIIGRCDYLTGCTQLGLVPKAKDGKIVDTEWFDEGRVKIIGDGVTAPEVSSEENGGPNRDCPK